MPRDAYPKRDDVVRYLRDYAAFFSLPVKLGVRTEAVDASGAGFLLRQSDGSRVFARKLIVATGAFGAPVVPQIEGASGFAGRILHSSEYLTPAPFEGQRVVVVGAGNSAVQIAAELAALADVTLAVRSRIRYLPQRILGKDVHWWFDKLRLNQMNLFSDHGVPVIDDGRYRRAIREGRPGVRPMFERFQGDGIVWSDGEHERVDQVIFATGFRAAMGFLKNSGALMPDGRPFHSRGVSTRLRGLGFVGLSGQTGFASATLRGAGPDARHVVNRLLNALSRPADPFA
jgi:putative flavoprotein involved in K+ transport